MPISRSRKRQPKNGGAKQETVFQPDYRALNQLEWVIRLTQPAVLIAWFVRLVLFTRNPVWWEDVLFWGGTALALVSQLRIFLPTRLGRRPKLFTGDVFKYTRHPMYTGVVIADLSLWHGNWYRPHFLTTALAMYGTMILVGWMHEQEMLAKFGPPAERYYARTPRLFFLYPFIRKNE
jgi:protein-S-isoprenylcysteine O-methyltransferase Ste14